MLKNVDAFLPTLKLVTDWFVTRIMLEKFTNVIFPNDDIDSIDRLDLD